MKEFVFTANPARVVFGTGTLARASDEAASLAIHRPFIVTTPQQRQLGEQLLVRFGTSDATLFSEAAMHTPVTVTERAMDAFVEANADGLVAIGRGSTIGLSKAIALRTDAPQLAIPTTYAGSEMTTILGQTEGDRKTTVKSLKVLPETVIYDVALTRQMPLRLTVTSGMNAIAHAVEAIYAENASPMLTLMAREGIATLYRALNCLVSGDAEDLQARGDALYGAWLCATCLGLGGVALHHKICHVLGGTFGLPHAETHTIILPHAIAYNLPAAPELQEHLAAATGTDDPSRALHNLTERSGAPPSLRQLGMPLDGIADAVRITLENPYTNPRALEAAPLTELLTNA